MGYVQPAYASKPQITSTQMICSKNSNKSKKGITAKKHRGNKYKNIMWERNFLDKNIITDFVKNSKKIPFNKGNGISTKQLRRKIFFKKIIVQLVDFFVNEY